MAYFDNGNKLFDDARKNQYAIGAYNINNLEWTRAILRAAAETNTPVLIQVSMGAAKVINLLKIWSRTRWMQWELKFQLS